MMLCAIAVLVLWLPFCLPVVVQAQYYHVGLNQGIGLPQRALARITTNPTWLPSLSIFYYPKNSPIAIGGSIAFQPFERNETVRQGEGYDLLSIPVSICFQYTLLPDNFRPYYGVETGVAWVRYRFFDRETFQGTQQLVSLVVAPNAGVKITLFEEMDVDVNVRYQFLFHDPFEWGSARQFIQGYQILGISLGFNYRLFRVL
jgi:outer membrane protein W